MRRKWILALAVVLSLTFQGCDTGAIKQFLAFLQEFSADLRGLAADINKTKKKQLRTLKEIEKAMADIRASLSGRFGKLGYGYNATDLHRMLSEGGQIKILQGIFGKGINKTDAYKIVRRGEIEDAIESAAHRLGSQPDALILYAAGLLRELVPAKENLSAKIRKLSEKVKTKNPSTQKAIIETKELSFRLRAYGTMVKNASLLLGAAQKIRQENAQILKGARQASRITALSSLEEEGMESLLGYQFFKKEEKK